MKKIWSAIVIVLFCISLCACDEQSETETLKIKDVSLAIASYWEEEGSENGVLKYYAEKDSVGLSEYKSATLDIEFRVDSDPNYDVSFEGLLADNENMISVIESNYNGANVLSYDIFESDNGVKGILYNFNLNISIGIFSEKAAEGYTFCFPSESDRRWYYVTMIFTKDATDHEYENDYMNTLSSIKCTGITKPNITTESLTVQESTPPKSVQYETTPTEAVKQETIPTTTGEQKIEMTSSSSEYIGKNPQDVENELSKLGFENISIVEKSTSDINKTTGVVDSITAGTKSFNKGDALKKDTQITITFLKLELPYLTVETNDDFAAIMKITDQTDVATIKSFADKYKGKTIKFDGCVALMMQHGSYKTRFDVCLANGNYTGKVYGPLFAFEDVSYYDMNVSGSDSVSNGMLFTIEAKILGFNEEGCYIILDPVSLVAR